MTLELKVGDWVRLTGLDWEDYTEGITTGSVVEVTEVVLGVAYAGPAGSLYFSDTPGHQISGFEWELADPIPRAMQQIATLAEQLGIAQDSQGQFQRAVEQFAYTADPVDPDHYKFGNAEVIEIVRHLGFLEGNVVKYVARAERKGNRLEDLKKARKYLDWAIEDAEAYQ